MFYTVCGQIIHQTTDYQRLTEDEAGESSENTVKKKPKVTAFSLSYFDDSTVGQSTVNFRVRFFKEF